MAAYIHAHTRTHTHTHTHTHALTLTHTHTHTHTSWATPRRGTMEHPVYTYVYVLYKSATN